MIVTWDIDRISYAVEEEAQRQFLKRIAPEKRNSSGEDAPQNGTEKSGAQDAPSMMSAALENLITRRAEFLWQNLLRSGCIDFPRADVKLAIKTIREENPAGDLGDVRRFENAYRIEALFPAVYPTSPVEDNG